MVDSDESRFRPLSEEETGRFVAEGPGSPSAVRWLSAVVMLLDPAGQYDMSKRHVRKRIASGWYKRSMATSIAMVMGMDESFLLLADYTMYGFVTQMEPMTACSPDTLIRFSMTRHDATDLLCSKRIGDPVGAMVRTVRDDRHRDSYGMSLTGSNADLLKYMIRHMVIPVATHPFSSLQGIVNAVCYGVHGSGKSDPSGVNCEKDRDRHTAANAFIAPLSGVMEYSGPSCSPALMAKMLSADMFAEVAGRSGNDIETLIASMPGAETMDTGKAAAEAGRIVKEAGQAPSTAPKWIFEMKPMADYRTMADSLRNGVYRSRCGYLYIADHEDMADDLWIRGLKRRIGHDAAGSAPGGTYGEAFRVKWNADMGEYTYADDGSRKEPEYAPLSMDMADVRFLLTAPRPSHTDPTLLHDMLKAMLNPATMPIIPELAGPAAGYSPMSPVMLRDPVIMDAAMTAYDLIVALAAPAVKRLPAPFPPSRMTGPLRIVLVPEHALDLFFTDLHHGFSYDFALQTLASRTSLVDDGPRDPDFHGLAVSFNPDEGEYLYRQL